MAHWYVGDYAAADATRLCRSLLEHLVSTSLSETIIRKRVSPNRSSASVSEPGRIMAQKCPAHGIKLISFHEETRATPLSETARTTVTWCKFTWQPTLTPAGVNS